MTRQSVRSPRPFVMQASVVLPLVTPAASASEGKYWPRSGRMENRGLVSMKIWSDHCRSVALFRSLQSEAHAVVAAEARTDAKASTRSPGLFMLHRRRRELEEALPRSPQGSLSRLGKFRCSPLGDLAKVG